MGKDVILDRYARLYEIPFQLARLGHDVAGFCLSYQGHDEGGWEHEARPGRLSWQSRSPGWFRLATYLHDLLRDLREFGPDIVIGASDIPNIAVGRWAAKRLAVPYVADLYDNFEGFGQARIPGMVPILRRAVRDAALVTTTSEPLKELVVDTYGARGDVIAMPSTVDRDVFRYRDRAACRRALGLPESALLVGTAGGLHQDKGVDALYEAWPSIRARKPDVHLVLAGPFDESYPPPSDSRVLYLGQLPHARMAELFSALDVGVIYLRDTPFGRYCFPQKAYEMLACGLPIVATEVGVMPNLLASAPEGLYLPDDAAGLADAVIRMLDHPTVARVVINDWAHIVGEMEKRLVRIAGAVERSASDIEG